MEDQGPSALAAPPLSETAETPNVDIEVEEEPKADRPTLEDQDKFIEEVSTAEETERQPTATDCAETPQDIQKTESTNTVEIPSDISVTTSEDDNEEVDTTVLLVRMGQKREKKVARIRRRAEREQFLEDARNAGKELVTKQEHLDRIKRRQEEEARQAELDAIAAEEANKELRILAA